MKKEIKDKWVAALRSRKYKQGAEALHRQEENSFCCLGVLCDLHAQETGNKWKNYNETSEYMDESDVLPSKVMVWAGIKHQNPPIAHRTNGLTSLAELNDSYGLKFYQIARLIERHWEEM